jgi:hypothetical protein
MALKTVQARICKETFVTMMKEKIHLSETSVLTRATRRNIPEDVLHSHCRENLKSYIALTC